MASTVTAGKLVVKLSESIFLNGEDHGSVNTMIVPSINEIYKRIVTIPVNDGSIGSNDHYTLITTSGDTAASAVSHNQFIIGDMKYVRITNLNDTAGEGILLQIARDDASDGTDEECVWFLLEEGKSFILHTFSSAFDGAGGEADTPTLTNITDIRAVNESETVAVDLEIFVASAE